MPGGRRSPGSPSQEWLADAGGSGAPTTAGVVTQKAAIAPNTYSAATIKAAAEAGISVERYAGGLRALASHPCS